MLKVTSALFLSATLFTTTSQAAIQEQQWGNWFGNTSGMEFSINADNDVGERITLTCTEGHLGITYSVPAKNYSISSGAGLKEPGLNINSTHYQLGEAAFMALKNTRDEGVLEVTEASKPLSKPFKTAGLQEALKEVTWQDCISR
ncbi:MAG TPA: hypothetical protein VH187_10825 [Scandinavium sp.]|jgi:hypothetical protein|uniref:hypothetical protein n=1 Tax=Scandinavium sp. TaxID=2830653 RepID=UPI002E30C522|nr:hypothetical protein [Scandinavium sp.]HEX4501628.1 hypothetical protein [Scandinavium sp.]